MIFGGYFFYGVFQIIPRYAEYNSFIFQLTEINFRFVEMSISLLLQI